ncbi:MAG: DUF1360 domain-containing protein [Anaerolineae bacterium]|nr:DUF1360 domain-containing protein [Anaerolineae bacterium]
MASDQNTLREQRMAYSALTVIFFSLLGLFNLLTGRKKKTRKLKPMDLAMLGLSAYRMGRLVSYDLVFQNYRASFTETMPDPTGAGDTVMPAGTGWRRAIGELIACPICAGTWISAGLVYGMELLPGPTRVLMTIMSGIGLAELVNAATEYLQWNGQAARERAGAYSLARKRGREVPQVGDMP